MPTASTGGSVKSNSSLTGNWRSPNGFVVKDGFDAVVETSRISDHKEFLLKDETGTVNTAQRPTPLKDADRVGGLTSLAPEWADS